jgi:hypothetical protein
MPIALKLGVNVSKITPNFKYGKSLLIIFIAHLLASFVSTWFGPSDSFHQIVSVDLFAFSEIAIFIVIFCLIIKKELKKFKPNIKQLAIVFSFLLATIVVTNGLFKLLEAAPVSLNTHSKSSVEDDLKKNNRISINQLYSKDDQHVYFGVNKIVPEADPSTFQKTDSEFFIDKSHVFWAGKILPEADPNSFKIINSKWGQDSQNLYFINRKILNDNIDLASFALVPNSKNFAKDKNNLYKLGHSLEVIEKNKFDYETFTALGGKYQKDKNGIYFDGELIKNVDIKSFQVLSKFFSKDKTHIFRFEKIFKEGPESEIATFEGINNEYIKDNQNIYNSWGIVKGPDIGTFVKISDSMAKDKNNVYGPWEKLRLVDPETFIVIGKEEKYGKDKNGFYNLVIFRKLEGKELENFYKDFPEFH